MDERQLVAQQGQISSRLEGGRAGGRAGRRVGAAEHRVSQGAQGSAGLEPRRRRRGLLRLPEAGPSVYGHTTLNAPDLV